MNNGQSERRLVHFRYTSNGPVPLYNKIVSKKKDHSTLWAIFFIGLFITICWLVFPYL